MLKVEESQGLHPDHVGSCHLKHVVRNRFVGQNLEGE